MASLRVPSATPDRGDVLLGWLTRLVIGFAVVGVLGFDGVSMMAAQVSVQDQADLAARNGATTWATGRDVNQAYAAAVQTAAEANAANEIAATSFSVAPDGAVTLTVQREAPTFVVRLVPPLRRFAHAEHTSTSQSQS